MESDPVGPATVYGRTKLAGERAVAEANPNHLIVRTAWLFGIHGANFVETMLRVGGRARRGAGRRRPDRLPHLHPPPRAQALLELAAGERTGIQHLAGGGAVSWHGFAREIFDAAGLEVDLQPCTTDEFPRPAPAPGVVGARQRARGSAYASGVAATD